MLIVENVILSDDIIENCFICDLPKCKGLCCAGGDRGAPLERGELPVLEKIYPEIKQFLTPDGIREIEATGRWIRHPEGSLATPVIHNRECAYSFYDDQNVLRCGIERAFREGVIEFQKPISCHLYPIRVIHSPVSDSLNYHRWDICEPARQLGDRSGIPVYEFLKSALIRKYGENWFNKLEKQIQSLKTGK